MSTKLILLIVVICLCGIGAWVYYGHPEIRTPLDLEVEADTVQSYPLSSTKITYRPNYYVLKMKDLINRSDVIVRVIDGGDLTISRGDTLFVWLPESTYTIEVELKEDSHRGNQYSKGLDYD